jgi:hypothetical protein
MADRRESEVENTPEPAGDDTPVESEERELTTEELRRQVEEKYDFENFGPRDMEQMTAEEWDAVFDPETWITGTELLDRVEADLKHRVVSRDVFARVERLTEPDRVVAYSDEGYAVVYEDGSVEGQGTVRRDVEPTVALCSMDDYDVPEMPEGELLPRPAAVPEGSGEFGNLMLQVVAAAQLLAGLVLMGVGLFTEDPLIGVAGLGFAFIGLVLFFTVANARLSDRFRADQYRARLRAVGIDSEERPVWFPEDEEWPPKELEGIEGA